MLLMLELFYFLSLDLIIISVIDQGYAYLSLLLNNNAEFILKFNENKKGF